MGYNREKAIAYATKWAYDRNPAFYDFENLGGDCTNFISQCLYAGCGVMNYTPVTGWYFISLNKRSPSWTGVPFLYNFLINNKGPGPYGAHLPLDQALPADVIQLNRLGVRYTHSLLIIRIDGRPTPDNIYLAAHTNDTLGAPLSSYTYAESRLIHIVDARG